MNAATPITAAPIVTGGGAAAAVTPEDGGPRLYGVVDVVKGDRIAGWVIDRRDAGAAVDVEIAREGRPIATVRADRPRRDLERSGVGTGNYGFVCELAEPLEPGLEFTLTVTARSKDGASVELRRAGAGSTDPSRRLLERIYALVSQLQSQPRTPPQADAGTEEVLAATARLAAMIEDLHVAQVRIEASLSAIEPPAVPGQGSVKVLAGIALAAGLGSLALGIASMVLHF